ncbi:DUF72 domain-containing protein [Janibacter sp. DB-40]|uniref:DUF72 domain-containing protein n=1 Tax=Janibacter sp. DB-40 TaxID=3028808 RepID=UPI002404DF74|nr:DUF72 domain-containing protein [Janibacter sp. DB-40]
MARYYIGTSGWRYAGWRGDFYPVGLPQRRELAHAAEQLPSLEINGSFYSLQRPTSYARWREETPDDFCFAVKGGRFITHMKRLRDVESPLANFVASGVLALGEKLGPILWQLPERLAFDEALLTTFFDLLPRTIGQTVDLAARHDDKLREDRVLGRPAPHVPIDQPVRHALEPRHPSFDCPEARELMRRHGICMVVADSAGRWPRMGDSTADFHYVRLHGDTELYTSGYSSEALDTWADRCRTWAAEGADVHVYFDNDAKGHAPHDAVALLERLRASP